MFIHDVIVPNVVPAIASVVAGRNPLLLQLSHRYLSLIKTSAELPCFSDAQRLQSDVFECILAVSDTAAWRQSVVAVSELHSITET